MRFHCTFAMRIQLNWLDLWQRTRIRLLYMYNTILLTVCTSTFQWMRSFRTNVFLLQLLLQPSIYHVIVINFILFRSRFAIIRDTRSHFKHACSVWCGHEESNTHSQKIHTFACIHMRCAMAYWSEKFNNIIGCKYTHIDMRSVTRA